MPAMTALKPTSRSASNTTRPVANNGSLTTSGRTLRAVLRNASRAATTSSSLASSQSSATPLTFDPSSKQRTRLEELWSDPKPFFSDGRCVVICAKDRLFCMVKRPLYTAVPALPKALTGKENMYKGCPVIVLDDSSDDVEVFLLALTSASFAATLSREPLSNVETYRMYAAILRLSHKYRVASWRKRALQRLACMFPITLARLEELNEPSGEKDLKAACAASLLVADVARAVGALWLLPSATLYRLSSIPTSSRSCSDPLKAEEIPIFKKFARLWPEYCPRMFGPLVGCKICDRKLAAYGKMISWEPGYSMGVLFRKTSPVQSELCGDCQRRFRKRHGDLRLQCWNSLLEICGWKESLPVLARQMRKDTE
ncbi:uncharacterized protein SCHCODRAFT_02603359 [Schizophyllum commune H4-8]|uniref:BTB domain-containing protein n=1 Tax=Schizophyllum commune (strain H4-8 / FGSC 9210) TaxID=578458 RepID=D8QIZ0_SCHCM|nr:uncharacterized protein SCHCODRAFT_02603359 [Schizophyllum commune H4-8]KAI5886222.1 hypothetical protein SCHCODRAFT_02603359 [Schizophyllum commune H4-8]